MQKFSRVEHLDGRLRTSEAGSLYFYTATAVYEIRLTAFLADNLMNRHLSSCGGSLRPDELPKHAIQKH